MSQRGTIFLEEADILSHESFAGDQYILRINAPKCAQHATPGSFMHITCDPALPMRRPISIMRVDGNAGWIDLLYKAVGTGTRLLAKRKTGESISTLGPIGNGFTLSENKTRPLLIGGGVGMPPMIFIADELRKKKTHQPFVILGSEVPFPFKQQPSQFMLPGIPEGVIGTMPLMEDWGIACRLASQQDFPGCFNGYVTDLARTWLNALDEQQRNEVEIFSCGPHPMLEAVAKLAKEFSLPSQLSLEEFMACGVGGCAGCTVPVQTENGMAMKRVCVDGPVFSGETVFG